MFQYSCTILREPLKLSNRDFSWGKVGRCVWLTTYQPCSAETSRKSGALIYPEPLGPPRPVAGHLYLLLHVSLLLHHPQGILIMCLLELQIIIIIKILIIKTLK